MHWQLFSVICRLCFFLVIQACFGVESESCRFSLAEMSLPGADLDMGQLVEIKWMGDGIGGGRGVFAKRNIRAGEVVFADIPLLETEESEPDSKELLHVQLARRVLQSEQRGTLIQQLACLYPQSLSELTPEILEKARAKHGGTLAHLASIQTAPPIPDDDVFLVLMKVCFSAFCGGIYVRKAMLNHACRPNCIAFQPGQRTSSDGRVLSAAASEVRSGPSTRCAAPSPRTRRQGRSRIDAAIGHGGESTGGESGCVEGGGDGSRDGVQRRMPKGTQ
jgi:hypothetical protein